MAEFDPSSFLDIGDTPGAKSGGGDDIARLKTNLEKGAQDPLAPFKGAPSKAFKKGTPLGQSPALDQHGELKGKPSNAAQDKKAEAIQRDKDRLSDIELYNDYLMMPRLRQILEERGHPCKQLPFDAPEHVVEHALKGINRSLSSNTASGLTQEIVGMGNQLIEKAIPDLGRNSVIITEKGPVNLPGLNDMFQNACNNPASPLGPSMEELTIRLKKYLPEENYLTRFLLNYTLFVREVYNLKKFKGGVSASSPEDQQAQAEEAERLQSEFAGL